MFNIYLMIALFQLYRAIIKLRAWCLPYLKWRFGRIFFEFFGKCSNLYCLLTRKFFGFTRLAFFKLFLASGKLIIPMLAIMLFLILIDFHLFKLLGRRLWRRPLNITDKVQIDLNLLGSFLWWNGPMREQESFVRTR